MSQLVITCVAKGIACSSTLEHAYAIGVHAQVVIYYSQAVFKICLPVSYRAFNRIGGEMELEKSGNLIRIKKGEKHFEVSKSGGVRASMPLHSFETSSAKRIHVDGNLIKVIFIDGKYTFRV